MTKKDHIFSYILFFFGIVLFLFAFGMLIYQIIHTCQIDWAALKASSITEYKETRNYVMVEYITILFKLVIASYAIVSKKHLDEAINPLFTFTCLYFVFVILQTILYFSNGGFALGLVVSSVAIIDMIVSVLFFGITFLLKLDDWKSA